MGASQIKKNTEKATGREKEGLRGKAPSTRSDQAVSEEEKVGSTISLRVVSRSVEQKQEVYYPRVSAEAEDVRYTIRGFGVLIKNDF